MGHSRVGEEKGDGAAVLLPRNALLHPLANRKAGLDDFSRDGTAGDFMNSGQWSDPSCRSWSQGS